MLTFAPPDLNQPSITSMTHTIRILAAAILLSLQAQSCRTSSAATTTSDTISTATISTLRRLMADSLYISSAWRCDSISITIAADSIRSTPAIKATVHRPSTETIHISTVTAADTATVASASTGIHHTESRSGPTADRHTSRHTYMLLAATLLIASALLLRKLTR